MPWPPPANWRAQLLEAWLKQHGTVAFDSVCRTGELHEWSNETPKDARGSKIWRCTVCAHISVTVKKYY